jgi:Ni/Co efflux regulator RcnB
MKMQRMKRWIALIAVGGSVASVAWAQPPDDQNMMHHDQGPGDHRMMNHDHGPARMAPGQAMHRDEGPGPDEYRHWNRGDRLPSEYRDRQYVIDDWREHRLTPPPRGYHWVEIGGDYLLVAIGSGIVLRIGP